MVDRHGSDSAVLRKRDSSATLTGHLPKRSLMVWKSSHLSMVTVANADKYPEWKPGNEFRAVREKSLKGQ